MAEQPKVRRRTLGVQRGGSPIVALGGRSGGLSDLYHGVLRIPVWGLLLILAAIYLSLNFMFAGLYLLDPGGVANLPRGDFADAFFFSVQTVSTVGYGVMSPISVYANVIVTLECFTGLVLVAVTTGVIFARVSKPTSRVVFSKIATITRFDGQPYLMFRAVNERANQIMEAEVMLNLARQVTTAEGHAWRRFEDLAVTRRRSPLFVLSWTIMHPLDDNSPLRDASPDSLRDEQAEIIVVVSGVDDIFAQRVHARHAYQAEDIVWDKEFENVLSLGPDGRWVLDYRKFHRVRDPAAKPPH